MLLLWVLYFVISALQSLILNVLQKGFKLIRELSAVHVCCCLLLIQLVHSKSPERHVESVFCCNFLTISLFATSHATVHISFHYHFYKSGYKKIDYGLLKGVMH